MPIPLPIAYYRQGKFVCVFQIYERAVVLISGLPEEGFMVTGFGKRRDDDSATPTGCRVSQTTGAATKMHWNSGTIAETFTGTTDSAKINPAHFVNFLNA